MCPLQRWVEHKKAYPPSISSHRRALGATRRPDNGNRRERRLFTPPGRRDASRRPPAATRPAAAAPRACASAAAAALRPCTPPGEARTRRAPSHRRAGRPADRRSGRRSRALRARARASEGTGPAGRRRCALSTRPAVEILHAGRRRCSRRVSRASRAHRSSCGRTARRKACRRRLQSRDLSPMPEPGCVPGQLTQRFSHRRRAPSARLALRLRSW
mmetsp:Transcript_49827/g.157653  ORF Transcript_49827/g.157653 Transcript_49827/m.157653 type:complete len:216 (-) Transcript_49827:119-766(-)